MVLEENYFEIGKEYDNMKEVYSKISDETKGLIRQVYETENLPIISEEEFDKKHNNIMKIYNNDVVPLRNQLDAKKFELEGNDKSLQKEARQYNQLTSYSNLFLTVLATTGVYYLFFKLSK